LLFAPAARTAAAIVGAAPLAVEARKARETLFADCEVA